MMTFAWQSVASMIVAIIVWDRSEFILLKHLCSDIRQVAFYSIAFSMAEWLIMSATIFASAAGASVFAQYGRDKSRVPDMTASTFRYIALTSVPMHFVAAALSAPALVLIYGKAYAGAAIVVTLSPLMCLPKAFSLPIQSLLQAYEKQSYIVGATIFAGVLDMAVAWYLIPYYGAVGACIGSGAAQFTAIGLMWAISIYVFKVKLPWVFFGQITFISVLASLTAHYTVVLLTPRWGIVPGGCAALIVFFGLLYVMRVLKEEDRTRIQALANILPGRVSGPVNRIIRVLVRQPLAKQASLK
jgi:O-antigen/teichoic acid export membrane protein